MVWLLYGLFRYFRSRNQEQFDPGRRVVARHGVNLRCDADRQPRSASSHGAGNSLRHSASSEAWLCAHPSPDCSYLGGVRIRAVWTNNEQILGTRQRRNRTFPGVALGARTFCQFSRCRRRNICHTYLCSRERQVLYSAQHVYFSRLGFGNITVASFYRFLCRHGAESFFAIRTQGQCLSPVAAHFYTDGVIGRRLIFHVSLGAAGVFSWGGGRYRGSSASRQVRQSVTGLNPTVRAAGRTPSGVTLEMVKGTTPRRRLSPVGL